MNTSMKALKKRYATAIKFARPYVKVEKVFRAKLWRVMLKVGAQGFPVGPEYDVKDEAVWYSIMLSNALLNLHTQCACGSPKKRAST
jgi:hypothetical protein